MGRLANALKMVTLLISRGKMSIGELAQIIEVSPSMIRKYKDDLEQVNIYIDSQSGKYGGYSLDKSNFLSELNITQEDNIALKTASEYLKNSNFVYLKEFEYFCDKLNCSSKHNQELKGDISFYTKSLKTKCNIEIEKKKYIEIMGAIITKTKIEIEYFSLTSGLSKRVLHPYAIYEYKGDSYLAAFCEKKKKILDFKLIRIKNFKILGEIFVLPTDFSLKEVLINCIGIYKDEEINLKLIIQKPMSYIVDEKIWVENQKIIWNEDNSIIFEAKMRGLTEIKSWILGMGSDVEILEPKELKEEVIQEIQKMKGKYI